jgi:hypothetical protein
LISFLTAYLRRFSGGNLAAEELNVSSCSCVGLWRDNDCVEGALSAALGANIDSNGLGQMEISSSLSFIAQQPFHGPLSEIEKLIHH